MKYLNWLYIPAYCLILSGCSSMGYYMQAISGQMEVTLNRESIKELISRSDTDDYVRQKLLFAKDILEFAHHELLLPDNGSYRHYTDLNRPYVVWNVIATREFSLQPKTWCYLFLGCLSYRGFFKQEAAKSYAESLRNDSYEVYIGGVSAYSTLGWFEDPIINPMLYLEDWEIARLIFHELAHQIIYIKDDTDFNEAFADAVSRIGLEQWLQSQSDETSQLIQQIIAQEDEFIDIVLAHRTKLVDLYASDQSESMLRSNKLRILTSLRETLQRQSQHWVSKSRYQSWLSDDINNARLAIVSTYRTLLPEFMKLYDESQGDLGNFYKNIIELSKCTAEQRDQLFDRSGYIRMPCGK